VTTHSVDWIQLLVTVVVVLAIFVFAWLALHIPPGPSEPSISEAISIVIEAASYQAGESAADAVTLREVIYLNTPEDEWPAADRAEYAELNRQADALPLLVDMLRADRETLDAVADGD